MIHIFNFETTQDYVGLIKLTPTRLICKKDVFRDGKLIFKKGSEYQGKVTLTNEFVITQGNKNNVGDSLYYSISLHDMDKFHEYFILL